MYFLSDYILRGYALKEQKFCEYSHYELRLWISQLTVKPQCPSILIEFMILELKKRHLTI
jgi:hypothetical protein